MNDCLGMKLFSGTSNLELAKKISFGLGIPLGKCKIGRFSNGEINVSIEESVRNFDVYIIQSTSSPNPNDYLIELLIMVDAVKRASPKRITAVMPYFGYAIQDKKEKGRAPIACKLVASMIHRAGVHRLITIDLHSPVIKGFWDIPVENISVQPLLIRYIQRNIIKHLDDDDPNIKPINEAIKMREKEDKAEKVIVSPDESGTKRVKSIADRLGFDMAIIYRVEDQSKLVGNVEGKVAILIDDLVDSCTKISTASLLLKKNGALDVHVLSTHGIFSADALEKVSTSPILELVVTNTIAETETTKKVPIIKHLDISPILTEAIRRQHFGEIGAYELETYDIEQW